ncbi:MAG: oligosaccharide flippase family protein [Pseudomonadota bacterium]
MAADQTPQSSGAAREVLRHGPIYFVGTLLNRAAGLLLLPLYLNVLTTAEFGVYAVIISIIDLLGVAMGGALGTTSCKLMVEKDDVAYQGRVFGSTLLAFSPFALVTLIAAIPVGALLAGLFAAGVTTPLVFQLVFVAVVLTTFFDILLDIIRVWRRSDVYVALSGLKAALFIGLNLLALFVFDLGVLGIILSTMISAAVLTIAALVFITKRAPLSAEWSIVKRLYSLAAGLIPGVLLDAHLGSFDKFLIGGVIGPVAAGFFGAAARIAHLLRVAVHVPFSQIWTMIQLTEEARADDTRAESAEVFLLFFTVFTAIACGLSILGPEVLAVIASDDKAAAAQFVPFAAAALVAHIMKWQFELSLVGRARTGAITQVSLIIALLATPAYIWAVYAHGAMGVAAVVAATGFVRAAMTGWVARRISAQARASLLVLQLLVLGVGGLAVAASWMIFSMGDAFEHLVGKAILLAAMLGAMSAILFQNGRRRAAVAGLIAQGRGALLRRKGRAA